MTTPSCCESADGADARSSYCETTTPKSGNGSFTIVIGAFAQTCKGQTFGGIGLLPVGVEPPVPFTVPAEPVTAERIAIVDHVPTARATPPDAPPPRV